jgi:hypothetical protein
MSCVGAEGKQKLKSITNMKQLLKAQSLTFDNHIPNSHLEMDKNLHFHKEMSIPQDGKKMDVSGLFYLDKNEIEVRWENHDKISNDKIKNSLKKKLVKEINKAIKTQGAAYFLENIKKGLNSIFTSRSEQEKEKIWNTAFDNIMSSLGIDKEQKEIIRNENSDLFCLYLDGNDKNHKNKINEKIKICRSYSKNEFSRLDQYYEDNFKDPSVYYITANEHEKCIEMGELTPDDITKFRDKGFDLREKK